MALAKGEAGADDGEEDNNLFKDEADQWNEDDDENDIIF
jgi:hypothetical protein